MKKINCGKKEELTRISNQRLFFSTFYQKYFIDPGNYKSPFNIQYSTSFNFIDTNLLKRNLYYFRFGEFISDIGWIFKSASSLQGFSLKNIFDDIMTTESLAYADRNMIFESGIYFSKETEFFSRSFAKIQDLAATVGGIIKLFVMFSAFFVSWFSKKSLLYDIMNFSYDLSKTTKDKSKIFQNTNDKYHSVLKLKINELKPKGVGMENISSSNNKFIKTDPFKEDKKAKNIPSFEKELSKEIVNFFSKFNNHWLYVFGCSYGKFKNYDLIRKLLRSKTDIYEYIKINADLKNLKLILLNEEEAIAIEYMKKEKLHKALSESRKKEEIKKLKLDFLLNRINEKPGNLKTEKEVRIISHLEKKILSAIK